MRHLFIAAIFGMGGILAGGAAIYCLREPAVAGMETVTAAESRQEGDVNFSHYVGLWNGSGSIQTLPADKRAVDSLWQEAIRSAHKADSTAPAQLRKAAQTNTADLLELLQKYESEQDHNLRGLLKSILFGIQKPEVVRFALRLTESSDPLHRIEGFELLSKLPNGERELRQAAMKAVVTESDPAILHAVVSALDPKRSTPLETVQITARLHQLAEHADAGVRKQSIELLSQWDSSANMESRFEKAFGDPSSAVRLYAIWALQDSTLRSDNIKHALFNIVRGDNESNRQAALYMLRSFNLTREESDLRQQVYAELNPG